MKTNPTLRRTSRTLFLLFLFCALSVQLTAQNADKKINETSTKTNKGNIIRGVVYDTDGLPLIGATVRNLQNQSGTVTNNDGVFTLAGTKESVRLLISYIGKKPQEIRATTGKSIKVILEDDNSALKEVVVTGIVTKKKDTFTGSSATFSGEELKSVGVQNPIASLKTLDPSFNVLDNDLFGSDPNRLPNIEIRGKSSMLGMRDELSEDPNQPLFILDGFESSLAAIYNLDINRIASMTILKDAASTAIYGSKAANGVVVVETVKPKAGQLRLNYSGSMDVSFPDLSSYNLMNSEEKLRFEQMMGKYTSNNSIEEMISYDNIYQKRLADIQSGVDTYWLSEPLRTGINHRHSLYVDGGSEGFLFGLGVNYNGVEGVMKKSQRDVMGANIDLTYRVGRLQFTNKFTAQQTKTDNPIVSFSEYAAANPYFKKYDEEGKVSKLLDNNRIEGAVGNPLYNDSQNSRNEGKDLMLSNFLIAEYSPITDLKLRARFGLTHTNSKGDNFISPDDTRYETVNILKRGSYGHSEMEQTRYEGEATAIYAKVLKEAHRFNVALGANISEQKSLTQGYSASGFPSGDFTYPSFSNGYTEGGRPSYYESVSRSVSAYMTGGYSLLDRYLMDVSYRVNGASVFGSNKKYINTWSVGLGWNLHNEKFIRDNLRFINYFKIRGSVGNPGNMNYSSSMSLTTFRYSYAAYNYFGLSSVLSQLGNDDLKWQTTLDKNIGLDLTIFNNRLVLTLDYYHKTTDPLLIGIGLPSSAGLTSYNTNLGKQISKGFTGIAQYYIFRDFNKRLTWSVRGTIRLASSKLDGIGNALEKLNKYGQSRSTVRYYDGADPDDIWTVRSAGIDPANGRELFIKKDGTYTYDFSYDEEVIVGNTRPNAEGTIGSNFGYKGFTVGATFRYRMGAETFNNAVYSKVENIGMAGLTKNQDKRALYNRWQKPGDIAQFKNIADATNTPMSSRFVQKENTLSLESFQIGYEFDPQLAGKLGISGMRINAYMNNIFRLSTIKEERGTSYPFARSVSLALSFTL